MVQFENITKPPTMKVIVIEKGVARKKAEDWTLAGMLPTYPCPIEWPVGSEWEVEISYQNLWEGNKDMSAKWEKCTRDEYEKEEGAYRRIVLVLIEKEEDEDKLWDEIEQKYHVIVNQPSGRQLFEALKQSFTIKRKQ